VRGQPEQVGADLQPGAPRVAQIDIEAQAIVRGEVISFADAQRVAAGSIG
jgi:hypothetical protein